MLNVCADEILSGFWVFVVSVVVYAKDFSRAKAY